MKLGRQVLQSNALSTLLCLLEGRGWRQTNINLEFEHDTLLNIKCLSIFMFQLYASGRRQQSRNRCLYALPRAVRRYSQLVSRGGSFGWLLL